jgi:hypothetical protein
LLLCVAIKPDGLGANSGISYSSLPDTVSADPVSERPV